MRRLGIGVTVAVLAAALLAFLVLAAEAVRAGESDSAAPAPPPRPEMPAGGTLTRTLDRVSVFGEEVPSLLGRSIETIRAYAARSGALEPIPFQIDERNPFGFLVLDHGEFAAEDTDKGHFDENDEIVFLAADAGDHAPGDASPAASRAAEEIEIRDPVDGGKGWVYLFAFADAVPGRSPVDYVSYDPANDRISSPIYRVGYPLDDKGNRRGYLDEIAVLPAGGGKGIDILDRLKIRFETQILFKLFTLRKNEDDFRSRILAWRDGPVRVARRVESALNIMLGFYAAPTSVESLYYKGYLEAPNVIDSPINVGAFVSDMNMRGTMDYDRNAVGLRFFCPACPAAGVLLTGRMDEEKRSLTGRPSSWQVIAAPPEAGPWAALNRIVMGPSLPLEERLYYDEDLSSDEPPESDPGRIAIGRQFFGMTKVKKGTHTFNAFIYFLPGFRTGDEKAVLDVLDHPLEVAVHGDGGGGTGAVEEAASADPAVAGEEMAPQEVFDRMAKAVDVVEDYTARVRAYSSTYRGRLLEGWRTYDARFKKMPRLVAWVVEDAKYNYDDPIDDGTEVVFHGDDGRILARGSGVKRVFGTIEVGKEDAAQWWWGESVVNTDLWSWVEAWRDLLAHATVTCRRVETAGKARLVLTLSSTRTESVALHDPTGVGASTRVKIKRTRIWIDPEAGFLPVRVESFIPGNPTPVAWSEVLDIHTNVGLQRDDFDLGIF